MLFQILIKNAILGEKAWRQRFLFWYFTLLPCFFCIFNQGISRGNFRLSIIKSVARARRPRRRRRRRRPSRAERARPPRRPRRAERAERARRPRRPKRPRRPRRRRRSRRAERARRTRARSPESGLLLKVRCIAWAPSAPPRIP